MEPQYNMKPQYETQTNTRYTRYPKHLNSFAAHRATILYETQENQNELKALLIIVLFAGQQGSYVERQNFRENHWSLRHQLQFLLFFFFLFLRVFFSSGFSVSMGASEAVAVAPTRSG